MWSWNVGLHWWNSFFSHGNGHPTTSREKVEQDLSDFRKKSIGAQEFVILEVCRTENAIFVVIEDGDKIAGGRHRKRG